MLDIIYTPKIRDAIRFATKVHEVDQKQTRKGKNIAYITHPLTVALILSQVNASEELIIAGLLHDAVEDCSPEHPVTLEDISRIFGHEVATLVQSVTEPDGDLPWKERKKQAREHVQTFSNDMLLLKSADILSNVTEIIDDHAVDGDEVFERFNASKEQKIDSQIQLIATIIDKWEDSPLTMDLKSLIIELISVRKGREIAFITDGSMPIFARANFASYQRSVHNLEKVPEKEIYTDKEIAHKLNTSIEQVREYIRVDVLKASEDDDAYNISAKDYDTFIKKHGHEMPSEFHPIN